MPRVARVVIPGCPHHVIQRGNRRQKTFFSDGDKELYLELLRRNGEKSGLSFLAYCLMDNHVHLIAIPAKRESLAAAIGETHRKYTTIINTRQDWKGYLWQGRFISFPMDEPYFYAAVRYIERNPVRAGLVEACEHYPWSSAIAHIQKRRDGLLADIGRFIAVEDWRAYLGEKEDGEFIEEMIQHERTGRPLGNDAFLEKLESLTGRRLRRREYYKPRR
jgi:putative transposase